MIGVLIGILFAVIVLGVIWWGIGQLLTVVPVAEPFRTIINVVMVLIVVLVVLWIIAQLLMVAGIHVPMHFSSVINYGLLSAT